MPRKLPFLDDTEDDTGLTLGRRPRQRAANVMADFPMSNGVIPQTQVVRQSRQARLGGITTIPISDNFAARDLLGEPTRRLPMTAAPQGVPEATGNPYGNPAQLPFAGQRDISVRGPHSARFQESIDRSRALRSFSAGTAADMRSKGMNDRAAAQRAFAATHLLDADMQTGNGILNRGMAMDQNSRANDLADSNINAQGANAWAMDENTRTGMAMRGPMVQGMNLQNQGQDLQNEAGRQRLPFAGPDAAADVAIKQSQSDATRMNSPFYARQLADTQQRYAEQLKQMQQQHTEAQKRIQQLEAERAKGYAAIQSENTRIRAGERTAAGKNQAVKNLLGTEEATPPAAPAPRQAAPDITPDDLAHTAAIHGITVDEVKRRLGVQ